MNNNKILLLTFLITTALSTTSQAQTIDYGSLEALFNEPVTTSATGQPQRASDVPVAMEIITSDDIRRTGATTVPDVLRMTTNLSVWSWTRSTADVNVRGFNQNFSPRLLVLVNGRQIYSDSYGNTLWENMPVQLNEIRQIEIVEGPNSALFGFNAVSGVVNIITYNPMYDDVSKIETIVGTNGYRQGSLVHSQKFGEKLGIRISGGTTSLDEFEQPAGTTQFYDPADHELAVDGILQLTDDSQLRIEATKTKSKMAEYAVISSPFNTKYATNSAKANYTANTGIGIIQANLYRNQLTGGTDSALLGDIEYKNAVTVAQLEDLFRIGTNHIFRVQAEYRRNTFTGGTTSDGSEVFYDVYAAGGMWNWKIRDNLAWTNAARVDHLILTRTGPLLANPLLTSNEAWDQDLTEFSYNSGLVWNPSQKDSIRLTTARGIQTPSLIDYGTDVAIGPISSFGNPRINAAVVTNYELGYSRSLDSIAGAFSANLFHQITKDIKSTGALITGLIFQPGNIGHSSSTGIDMNLKGKIGEHWLWNTSYLVQQAHDDISVNQGAVTSTPYNGEQATPTHTITAHLGYAKGKWETDAYARYVSNYEVLLFNGATYDPVDAGGHTSFSGRVGYNITDNLTVAVSGQELNHNDIRESSGPERERQVFLSLSASF